LIEKSKDPLHGITLERIVTELYEKYGWERLGHLIQINCFNTDPSVKSSLKFCVKHHGHEKKWKTCMLVELLRLSSILVRSK
jgi:uncharacterized protein (DUF2132 family)